MKRILLLLSFVALAAGCLHGGSPVPDTNQGEWARLRDRWTTQQTLYDKLDNRAFASATYQAPALREARVRRLAEWRSMSEAETEAALMQEREDAKRYEEFLVSLFTPDRRHNDLARDFTTGGATTPRATPEQRSEAFSRSVSGWRIGLLVEGLGELLPLDVQEVQSDPTLETLYPQIGHFDTVYRIRFPRPRGPGLTAAPFTLRISGAVGRLEFSWKPRPEDFVPADATAGQ